MDVQNVQRNNIILLTNGLRRQKIHGNKFDYTKSVYVNSKTPIVITCKIHGDFQQLPSEHLQGKGCKYCTKQAFHVIDSLANKYPEIASEWDYELNKSTGFTPQSIGIDTTRLFYWHCNNGENIVIKQQLQVEYIDIQGVLYAMVNKYLRIEV